MDEHVEKLSLSIQSGPLEAPPWTSFLRQMRQHYNGNFANLIFRRTDDAEPIEVHDAVAAPDWLWERYRANFAGSDPIPYFAMQPGQVYAYSELDSISKLPLDAFREGFLRPADLEHLLIFRVVEPGGCNIWVTITRSATMPAFSDGDRRLCERLARALVPALACYSALLDRSIETQVYRRAANLLSFGVITLDGEGRIVSVDEAAKLRIDGMDGLSIRGNRLHTTDTRIDLASLIAAALESKKAVATHLGDINGIDLLLVPLASRADVGPRAVRLMLYLSGRCLPNHDMSAHLVTLFGLSDTQARLAMLLAYGRSIVEAAAEIGITEQTARTYSKEIFARTGTTRQGELILRILTSVAVLD